MKQASLVAFHTTGLFLLFPLYLNGWLQNMWEDPTKITAGIFSVVFAGMVFSVFGKWRTVEFIRDMAVFAGLIGTLLGIILAFGKIDPSQLANVSYAREIGSALLLGSSVALYTSLVGAVGYVWLAAAQHFWGD